MSSTFLGVTIGYSGLLAYMGALNTTSNNIANSKTDGYTRQVVNRVEAESLRTFNSTGTIGTGVLATNVEQIRDVYYDYKYWENNQKYGNFYTKYYYTQEIEGYFEEENQKGATVALTELFIKLQSLYDNPSSEAVRNEAVNAFQTVATTVNDLYFNLQEIQSSVNQEIKSTVDQINTIAEQLSVLNKQIATIEVTGQSANELRDQRNLLIDQLSQLADVDVNEVEVPSTIRDSYGNQVQTGLTTYTVKLDGQVLVKDKDYYTLQMEPRTVKQNLSDADGLYDIVWSNGQDFNMGSSSIGGTLQGLIEVRDGNNNENLQGAIVAADVSDNSVTLQDSDYTDVNLMNLPEKGKLTLNYREYEYDGFEYLGDGKFKFNLVQQLTTKEATDMMTPFANNRAKQGYVGEAVDYYGVPYYLNRLNEFVRCFATQLNTLHTQGQTLNGTLAGNLYTGKWPTGDGELTFADAGKATFKSTDDTYYRLNAGNFTVEESLLQDSTNFATTRKLTQGVDGTDLLEDIMDLGEQRCINNSTPSAFFESLMSDISVTTKTAKTKMENRNNLSYAIMNQRLSVSGVDEDEEGIDLIKFQAAYNLCSKVISVMDECLDQLILRTGA